MRIHEKLDLFVNYPIIYNVLVHNFYKRRHYMQSNQWTFSSGWLLVVMISEISLGFMLALFMMAKVSILLLITLVLVQCMLTWMINIVNKKNVALRLSSMPRD